MNLERNFENNNMIAKSLKERGLVKIRTSESKPTKFTGKVINIEVKLTKQGETYIYKNWIKDIGDLFEEEYKNFEKIIK